MCGIAGILNLDHKPVSSVILKKMTDKIAHRGPDGEGQWIENFIGLGHRRLSIIDLSPSGQQPMISSDQRFVLSYNGEIYNFNELRVELESLGYKFKSKTDSEVVLYAFSHWGIDCIKKFNGMFAFCIWDREEKKLHIARDRHGIKPIYYAEFKNTFLFASEQKAIIEHPKVVKQLDKKALAEYFTFQNIFTNRTLIKGVKLFPPASIATISMRSKSPKINFNQYWDYHFESHSKPKDYKEYQYELDRLLNQAVNRQLVSDVELGSYLSGGIDSGALTALASKQLPYIKTFTCGFDLSTASGLELAFDERQKAEAMSALYKTEHYEMVLKSGDMERCLKKYSYHLEEPRVGQSYPNFYVAQLASKFVKVVLSGAGGDELFAGYPWRYYKAFSNSTFETYIDQYYSFWQRLISNRDLKNVFKPIWKDVDGVWTKDIFLNVFKNHKTKLDTTADYINHSLYFEAKTFLHGLLIVEDKLSMAHGLETRVPYLDNDLVDFAMSCPIELKLKNINDIININENEPGNKSKKYFEKTNDGKKILRDVVQKYVPSKIVKATKQGFSSPDSSWFKGESIDYVRTNVLNESSPLYDYLDFKHVRDLTNEHLEGKKNRRLLIWSLLNVNQYLLNEGF